MLETGNSPKKQRPSQTGIDLSVPFADEMAAAMPPEPMTISEWTERYRVLTRPPAEEPGPMRLSRTPYLVPIMDACKNVHVEQIVICKPAQIAGTECLLSIIGYYAHQEPCSIMLVMADQDTATYMSRERIQKMFESSPALSSIYDPTQAAKGEITLKNGSYIALGWASSVARLASRPMRIVCLDEVDKPGYSMTSREADPISLAIQRTETYFNRKIVITSTPTDEFGNVYQALTACDVIYDWHVPCPACGQFQPLRWSPEFAFGFTDAKYMAEDGSLHQLGKVVWEGGREATQDQIDAAGYQCGECGEVWDTIAKDTAVQQGRMLPREAPPRTPYSVGFHINRLYSLLGRSGQLPKLVRDWLDSFRDPKKRQDFINGALAEPWKQVVVTSTTSEILSCRTKLAPGIVPEDAVGITLGADMQKFGFWYVVRAWSRDSTSWLLQYGFLPHWDDLEQVIFNSAFPRGDSSGEMVRIWRAGIDTGGGLSATNNDASMTEEAYNWIRQNRRRGVSLYGTKGSSWPMAGTIKPSNVFDKMPSGRPIKSGFRILMLNTSNLKDLLFYRFSMAREGLPGAAYLHAETGDDYAKQVLAEEKRRNRKGTVEWTAVRKENHLLDAEIICHACAHPEWPGGGVLSLGTPPKKMQPGGEHKKNDKPMKRRPRRW